MDRMILLLLLLNLNLVLSARVLMLMHLSGSHVAELSTFGIELVKRGHEVYTIVPETSKYISLRKKGISVITFPATSGDIFLESNTYNDNFSKLLFNNELYTFSKLSQVLVTTKNLTNKHCKGYLENDEIMEQVKQIGFNIALVDSFLLNYCHYLLPHILDVPTVSVFGVVPFWDMGVPALPSFVPYHILAANDQMTMMDKVISTVFYVLLSSSYSPIEWDHELLTKFAPDLPTWISLVRKTQLFISLRDELLEKPVPKMPNTIMLPGITYSAPLKLPSKLEQIYKEARQGVILMTFGSILGFMPNSILKNFFIAFEKLSQFNFLVKFPLDSKEQYLKDVKIPRNIQLIDWIPQNDCLGHEKTVLFITHCGNNGQYEAIYHGVPMLAFPLFSDAFHNAFRIVDRGYGLSLNINEFLPSELEKTIIDIVNNKSISANVKRASVILKDREHPKHEGVYWIEHIIKFGGKHLRGASMDMPWYQLLMVDVILFIFVLLFIFVVTLVYIVKCVCFYFRRKSKIE